MDQRVRNHAEILVDWSARVEAEDDVVLVVGPDAHELAVAVASALGERGATLHATYASDEVRRAYLTAHDDDFVEPGHERALFEAADVVLSLGGSRNASGLADVPNETLSAYRSARQAVRSARFETRWVSTVHPTRSLAQRANMAFDAYRSFAYDAILRDWEALAAEMAELKEVLDAGSEIRLEGAGTELTMDITNRTAVNSAASVAYDSHNLPSGEVFTAPAGVEGHVLFDVAMTIRGRPVRDVRLDFEDDEVVAVEAAEGQAVIEGLLETDEGARRVGEFGVGMNRGIDRYTNNILFDEKMAGTVHLALGRAYDACLPEGEEGNESAVHVDLLADVSEETRLLVDGEVVGRNGRFRWEDEFEG